MPFVYNPLTGQFDIAGSGGGSGNVVSTGASVAGAIPTFTNTDGIHVTPSTFILDSNKNLSLNSLAAASVPSIFETNTHTRYMTFAGDKTDNLYSMPQIVLVNENSTAFDTTAGGISGVAINPNGGALRTCGSVNFASDGNGGYITFIAANSNGTPYNVGYMGPGGFFLGSASAALGNTNKPWAATYTADLILGNSTAGLYSAIEQNNSATLVYLHSLQYLWQWQFYDKTLVSLNSMKLQLDNRVFTLAGIDDAGANSTISSGTVIGTSNKTAGTGNSGTLVLSTGTSAGGTPGPVSINPGGVNVLNTLSTNNVLMNASSLFANTLRSSSTRQMVLASNGADDYYAYGQLTTVNTSSASDHSVNGTCGEWVGVMTDTTNYDQIKVASVQFLAEGAPGLIQFNTRKANGSTFSGCLTLRDLYMYPDADGTMDLGRDILAFKNLHSNGVFTNTIDTHSGGILNLNSAGVAAFTIDGTQILNNKVSANESTGSGTASLGSNSPATTNTAPFKWLKVKTSDGSTGYIPIWK